MTKKHFIAIADAIREHNMKISTQDKPFEWEHLATLADVFKRLNSDFMKERWIAYVNGQCGPNGGSR